MFIDNDLVKIVFIHIPKTGGISIGDVLKANYGGHQCIQYNIHHTLSELLDKYPKCNEYIKFSVVRNPWDKMVSQFEYSKRVRDQSVLKVNTDFNTWLKRLYKYKYDNTVKYFCGNSIDWLLNSDGDIDMDAILKFEQLNEHFKIFCEKYNLKYRPLPHKNVSPNRKPYQEYYNDETKSLVAKHFKKDIKLFDYKFDNSDTTMVPLYTREIIAAPAPVPESWFSRFMRIVFGRHNFYN
tara:strand:+ start:415 stop:1128 length:714 start_codon:yes stop_codon:yes gene_type:complete